MQNGKWFWVEAHIRAIPGPVGDTIGPMEAPSEAVLRETAERTGIDILSVREMTSDQVAKMKEEAEALLKRFGGAAR